MAKDDELVVIYRPANVIAANIVKGILEDAGIEVLVRSLQIPMYDDIAKMGLGCWGEILVRKGGDAGHARLSDGTWRL